MKLVITGASGKVGSSVVASALAQTSHTLLLIDKIPPSSPVSSPRVEYRTVDLLDYDAFLDALKGAGGLIHLAGYPGNRGTRPEVVHNTNVCLSYNALQAAAEAGVKKVVMASSVNAIGGVWSVHEPIYTYFPIDEDHPCHHSDPYSLSKRILELQASSIARANPGMTITSLRFHSVSSPDEMPDAWKDAVRARKDLWGWVDPEAAGRACLLALEAEWTGHEVVFVVDDTHRAVGSHAQKLVEEFYPGVEVRVEGGKLCETQSMYSNKKAEELLGWRPVGGKQPSKS